MQKLIFILLLVTSCTKEVQKIKPKVAPDRPLKEKFVKQVNRIKFNNDGRL